MIAGLPGLRDSAPARLAVSGTVGGATNTPRSSASSPRTRLALSVGARAARSSSSRARCRRPTHQPSSASSPGLASGSTSIFRPDSHRAPLLGALLSRPTAALYQRRPDRIPCRGCKPLCLREEQSCHVFRPSWALPGAERSRHQLLHSDIHPDAIAVKRIGRHVHEAGDRAALSPATAARRGRRDAAPAARATACSGLVATTSGTRRGPSAGAGARCGGRRPGCRA